MNPAQQRTMNALLLATFVSSIPATLILPMMPSLGVAFDVSPAQLGLLVGVYPLMSMLVSPFWGRLSDRYGRKPILIITLLGGALAFLFFAMSSSWLGLLAGRAMQGLAGTPRGIGFAVASDLSDSHNRAARMGSVTAAMAVAFTVGPIIGGLFMGENPDSWLGQLRVWLNLPGEGFNHVLPSMLGLLGNLIGALVVFIGFQETWKPKERAALTAKAAEQGRTQIHLPDFRTAILQTAVILAVAFFLLSGFIQGSLQFAFALWANMALGWGAQLIAWSGVVIGLGFAIGSGLVLKPLSRRVGQEKTVLTGTVLDAVGLLIFLYGQHYLPVALGGLFISALGGALWATTILSLLSREISERDQGLALGVANGASLLGRVVGPAFAGYLAASVAPAAPFVFILVCVALAIVRGVTLVRASGRASSTAR